MPQYTLLYIVRKHGFPELIHMFIQFFIHIILDKGLQILYLCTCKQDDSISAMNTKKTKHMKNKRKQQMLTEHFSLQEMVRSGTAIRLRIDNHPTEADIERMRLLCENVLEPLRRRFGVIRITSGFRSKELNKAIGGDKYSQHLRGEAADIHVSNQEVGRKMYDFIKTHCRFDQLLFEHSMTNGACWLHVSFKAGKQSARMQAVVFYRAA